MISQPRTSSKDVVIYGNQKIGEIFVETLEKYKANVGHYF